KPVSQAARIGDITQEEAASGMERRPALKGVHFALGPAFLQSFNTSGVGYSFTLGKAWDVNDAIIRLRGDLFGKGSALGLDFGLSAHFFFLQTDYSPFLGAEIGFGAARQDTGTFLSGDFHAGFWLGPLAGIQL